VIDSRNSQRRFGETSSTWISLGSNGINCPAAKKYAGVRGYTSSGSLPTYVNGRLFNMASHSAATVKSSSSVSSVPFVVAVIARYASFTMASQAPPM
jgi:hypothetical protein